MNPGRPIEIATPPVLAWWRYPYVWMVIAGPAAVVVAGFATLYIAIATPDPVDETYGMPSAELDARPASRAMAPAMAGRNHAATPTDDLPVKSK